MGEARFGSSARGYSAIGVQPGAGIDIQFHRHAGVRIESDYRRVRALRLTAATGMSVVRVGMVLR